MVHYHDHYRQMLQDLDESGIQMDRFCDNELLESLDQLIVQASTPTRVRHAMSVTFIAQLVK